MDPTPSTLAAAAPTGTSRAQFEKTCNELSEAIDKEGLGETYAKHQKLIMQYYEDVQSQAKHSFENARRLAIAGFWVLVSTLVYVAVTDLLSRTPHDKTLLLVSNSSMFTVAAVGVVGAALLEYIAHTSFVLYQGSAKQFGAFHICLERTHRYLLAYKMAEKIEDQKYQTLRDLVCIMANAPMISSAEVFPSDPAKSLAQVRELTDSLERK